MEKAEEENGRRIPGDKLGREREREREKEGPIISRGYQYNGPGLLLGGRVKNLDRSARRPLLQYFA